MGEGKNGGQKEKSIPNHFLALRIQDIMQPRRMKGLEHTFQMLGERWRVPKPLWWTLDHQKNLPAKLRPHPSIQWNMPKEVVIFPEPKIYLGFRHLETMERLRIQKS